MGRSRLLSRKRRKKAEALAAAEAAEVAAAESVAEADMVAEGGHVEAEHGQFTGEQDLTKLLEGLAPELAPEVYVFVTLEKADQFIGLFPLMLFNEAEGVTGIVPLEKADHADIDYQFDCRRITLTIHSALNAVGLISTVAEALEDEGIPCNVVSAFYHDHLFVPVDKAETAMKVIEGMMA